MDYRDGKILQVLDEAGPVGAVAYGCALDGRDVSFDEVYQVACAQSRALNMPVVRRSEALGTYHKYQLRGKQALVRNRERGAVCGYTGSRR